MSVFSFRSWKFYFKPCLYLYFWSFSPWTKWDLIGPLSVKSSCRKRLLALLLMVLAPSPQLLVLRSNRFALEDWGDHLPCLGLSVKKYQKCLQWQNRKPGSHQVPKIVSFYLMNPRAVVLKEWPQDHSIITNRGLIC